MASFGPPFDIDANALSADEAEAAVRALHADLHRHARLYYVEARPEVSDREYDRLYRELEAVRAAFDDIAV